jgi:hypothetical protein
MVNGEDLIETGRWESEYKWVVRLQLGDGKLPSCTGTLWGKYVLTAAHCLPSRTKPGQAMTGCVSRGRGDYRGSSPKFDAIAKIIRVVKAFQTDKFAQTPPDQDIAILELDRVPKSGGFPIKFTRTIPPIGTDVFLVGYGKNLPLNTFEPELGFYNLIDQHYFCLDSLLLETSSGENRVWIGGAWARPLVGKATGGDSGGPWFAWQFDPRTGSNTAVIFGVENGLQDLRNRHLPSRFQVDDEVVTPFAVKHPKDDDQSENPSFPYPQDPTYSNDVVETMRELGFPFYDDDTDESSQYSLFTKLRSTSSISLPTNVSSATGNANDNAMISGCYGKAAISWSFAVISFLMYF